LVAAKKISGEYDAIVLIYDGVRPLITSQLLSDNVHAVRQFGSAITSGPITETPIMATEGYVNKAFDRDIVQIAKATQSFWLSEILDAHEEAKRQGKNDYLDSCSMMIHRKQDLHIVPCSVTNIKITQFEDIYLLQAFLRAHEDQFFWRN